MGFFQRLPYDFPCLQGHSSQEYSGYSWQISTNIMASQHLQEQAQYGGIQHAFSFMASDFGCPSVPAHLLFIGKPLQNSSNMKGEVGQASHVRLSV
jgi:hypothetical protein